MAKQDEAHITVLTVTHEKLKKVAKSQRRSMRAIVAKFIDDAYEETKKGK